MLQMVRCKESSSIFGSILAAERKEWKEHRPRTEKQQPIPQRNNNQSRKETARFWIFVWKPLLTNKMPSRVHVSTSRAHCPASFIVYTALTGYDWFVAGQQNKGSTSKYDPWVLRASILLT